jgi:hypothetical protein
LIKLVMAAKNESVLISISMIPLAVGIVKSRLDVKAILPQSMDWIVFIAV